METIIDNHPTIRAIDKEIEAAGKRAKKQMDNDPWVQNFLKKNNIDIDKDFS